MKELHIDRKISFVERPPFPENMLIELTNACNHKCVFCGYNDMTRCRCFADKEFTLNIIKQAYDEGVREIGFYAIGCGMSSKIDPLFRLNLTHPDVFRTWVSFFIISDFYTVF